MDALEELTKMDRTMLNQCIQSNRENLASMEAALKRLEARDSDLNQTITEIRDALITSRQVLVRGNGIMNDSVIRLERFEQQQYDARLLEEQEEKELLLQMPIKLMGDIGQLASQMYRKLPNPAACNL